MKNIITTAALLVSLVAFSQSKTNINDVPRTIKITHIQYGVTCGTTGKSAVYVYHKDTNAPGFNPLTDREIVYTSNLSILAKTAEYQAYMRNK
jgi:hypothetical protein